MRNTLSALFLMFALAGVALAHGTNSHQLMGTVKGLVEENLTVTTPQGKEATVRLTAETKYEQDKKATDRAALVTGARVSIQLDEDNKTALKVKIGSGDREQR